MEQDALSAEALDALFARWRTMSAAERGAEQELLWDSLSIEGRETWMKQVELSTIAGLQAIADGRLAALNGRDRPFWHRGSDGKLEIANDSAIDVWLGLKERLVEEATRVRRGD